MLNWTSLKNITCFGDNHFKTNAPNFTNNFTACCSCFFYLYHDFAWKRLFWKLLRLSSLLLKDSLRCFKLISFFYSAIFSFFVWLKLPTSVTWMIWKLSTSSKLCLLKIHWVDHTNWFDILDLFQQEIIVHL